MHPEYSSPIRWAEGLTVYAPKVVPDEDDETLVVLHLVGPAESVKANWAAIMSKDAVRYVNRCKVALRGMHDHIKLEGKLPCGYVEHWLIHKQASLTEMKPDKGVFYLLDYDEPEDKLMPVFYDMLDKALPIPILPEWASTLFGMARDDKVICHIGDGCFGATAWKVKIDVQYWEEAVKRGIENEQSASSSDLYLP